MQTTLKNLGKDYKKIQAAQFSKGTPLRRVYHFLFSGDKIDLYNELFGIRNILEKKGIKLLEFLRLIDSFLASDLWVIQKITTIEQEILNLKTTDEYFDDIENQILRKKLFEYREKKLKNYFHLSFYKNTSSEADIIKSLYETDLQIEKESLIIFTTI